MKIFKKIIEIILASILLICFFLLYSKLTSPDQVHDILTNSPFTVCFLFLICYIVVYWLVRIFEKSIKLIKK